MTIKKPLHGLFRCPCGREFGGLTDHDQVERYCSLHASGTGLINTQPPEFAAGKSAQQEFDAAIGDYLKEGRHVPEPILEDRKKRGVDATEPPPPPAAEAEKPPEPEKVKEEEKHDAGNRRPHRSRVLHPSRSHTRRTRQKSR
jgi:hypothetical protein